LISTKYFFDYRNDNLFKESHENIQRYLDGLGYPKEVIENICFQKFIQNNPDYYLYYPYLFDSAFDFSDKKVLEMLSIAGFLYYRSIILMDDIFDNKEETSNFNDFLTINICQEETIKILCTFFEKDSLFWHIWGKRKLEYLKAYRLDKQSHNIFSFGEYEVLCDYKSSFGKIAIDALFVLTGKHYRNEYQSVLKSHKDFYVAFQILDDISDYEEDHINGQFNISKNYLGKKVDNIESYSLGDQKKLLYLEGVAGNLYSKAHEHILRAFAMVGDYKIPRWQDELQRMQNTITINELNINGYITFNKSLATEHIDLLDKESRKKDDTEGLQYLLGIQGKDGSWIDYFNDAGNSNVWTTSFVCYFLSFWYKPQLDLIKSTEFLISNRYEGKNLWGYNSNWIPDADSTSFTILALHSMGIDFRESELEEWFSFQNKDGGFCTYRNERELLASLNSKHIQNVEGWLSSHFCVSAVAYLVFCQLGINNDKKRKLELFLIDKLKDSHEIPYWWTSRDYAISFLVLACCINMNEKIFNFCCNELNKVSNATSERASNIFYVALRLLSTIKSKDIFKYDNSPDKLLSEILLNAQLENGSWGGNYSMKIPSPDVLYPERQVHEWKEGNKGTNIVLKDFNGVFTSVVSFVALENYKASLNGR
jgi:hypothetical protein|tara:strand:- start:6405 stop:8360 length:1956 start_codon:yes stop_codon:yes gene_type:complete